MSARESFEVMIRRVRQGDEQAARDLIREYEADLRVIARVRLTDPKLRRALDSMDICQSIMGNFFVRATSGQFELETPEQLMKLLATMVRNKVTDHARYARRDRRDIRRVAAASTNELDVAGTDASPSQHVANRELLQLAQERMTDEMRHVAYQRSMEIGWKEIAEETGASPEAVRKRFERAMNQIVGRLGLEEHV